VQPTGHQGYESSDSQGQALVDYYELDRANLDANVMRIMAKYPKLDVQVDMGTAEYGYQGSKPSKISRPTGICCSLGGQSAHYYRRRTAKVLGYTRPRSGMIMFRGGNACLKSCHWPPCCILSAPMYYLHK
jgi:hypothetical protein